MAESPEDRPPEGPEPPDARTEEEREADLRDDLLETMSLRRVRRLEFLRWLYRKPGHGGL